MICRSVVGEQGVSRRAIARRLADSRPASRADSVDWFRADRRGVPRRREEGRAALMPYMMGGFPDRETSSAVAAAYAEAAPTWSSSACRSPTRSPTAR